MTRILKQHSTLIFVHVHHRTRKQCSTVTEHTVMRGQCISLAKLRCFLSACHRLIIVSSLCDELDGACVIASSLAWYIDTTCELAQKILWRTSQVALQIWWAEMPTARSYKSWVIKYFRYFRQGAESDLKLVCSRYAPIIVPLNTSLTFIWTNGESLCPLCTPQIPSADSPKFNMTD